MAVKVGLGALPVPPGGLVLLGARALGPFVVISVLGTELAVDVVGHCVFCITRAHTTA